jgi:hypothetical protein
VRLKETNESEPLMTCRKAPRRRRNRGPDFYPASKDWEVSCLLPNRRLAWRRRDARYDRNWDFDISE